jgi:hypothetical protein
VAVLVLYRVIHPLKSRALPAWRGRAWHGSSLSTMPSLFMDVPRKHSRLALRADGHSCLQLQSINKKDAGMGRAKSTARSASSANRLESPVQFR